MKLKILGIIILSVAVVLGILFFHSTKDTEPQKQVVEAVRKEIPQKPTKNVEADLVEVNLDVGLRRAEELVWTKASAPQELYKFDALHSHAQSSAKVIFKSGAELNLKENTYVIIDGQVVRNKQDIDRAVMRSGKIYGKTKKELWILTSGALVKIKTQPKSQDLAETQIELEEGKKLKITLTHGEGQVLTPTTQDKKMLQEKIIKAGETLVVKAPAAQDDFGVETEKTDWLEAAKIIKEALTSPPTAPIAATPPPKTPETEAWLKVLSPSLRSETADKKTVVEGRVSEERGEVYVNGQKQGVKSDGTFSAEVDLHDGVNIIIVQWTSPQGKPFVKKLIVMKRAEL